MIRNRGYIETLISVALAEIGYLVVMYSSYFDNVFRDPLDFFLLVFPAYITGVIVLVNMIIRRTVRVNAVGVIVGFGCSFVGSLAGISAAYYIASSLQYLIPVIAVLCGLLGFHRFTIRRPSNSSSA